MENSVNNCVNCSLKSNAVSVLDKNELGLLEEGCSKIQFRKGEQIFKENTPAKYIAYIRNGFVKLCKRGINQKDYIFSISKKGAYLGIQNLSQENRLNYFSAIAISTSEICLIDTGCFSKLLKRNGKFAYEVISYVFNDEMNYFDRLVNNAQHQLPGKLANTLLYFRDRIYNQNSFNLDITRAELASLIGTSRESVSRLLKDFQDSQIIRMEKKEITILDIEKLEEIKQKG